MKLSTDRDSLLPQLQLAARAISTRTAVQTAISGILLRAEGDSVELLATDMEVSLRIPLEAAVERPGAAVLPGRLGVDVVRSLPAGPVTLEAREAERDILVSAGPARFAIRALPADEFPTLPEPLDDPIRLPAAPLLETIDRVAQAASRDEARPILTGIHVVATEGELTMVATDSYRLAVKRTSLDGGSTGGLEATIPARALRELSRIASGEGTDEVEISLLPNQVVFSAGGALLASRLIEGQFPNHDQLMPKSFAHDVRMSKEEFLDVVRRVSLMAQKNTPLRLRFSEGELQVSAETADIGTAEEALPAAFHGEGFEIGFNPEFLREGIESIDSGELLLRLIEPLRPGLLEAVEGDDFRYLVMPIRLNV